MSNDGLIIECMDLSHIHLAVLIISANSITGHGNYVNTLKVVRKTHDTIMAEFIFGGF